MVTKHTASKKGSDKSWDDDENEAQNNFLKWGKPGDFIFGTLVSKSQKPSTLPDKKGELQWIYEIKVVEGEYHNIDKKKNPIEPAIVLEAGEIISVGGRSMYDSRLARAKRGQRIGLKFTEEIEAKTAGYNDTKIIKTYLPKGDDGEYEMDEEFLAEDASDEGAGEGKGGKSFKDFK